jgi:hypothetical protein
LKEWHEASGSGTAFFAIDIALERRMLIHELQAPRLHGVSYTPCTETGFDMSLKSANNIIVLTVPN